MSAINVAIPDLMVARPFDRGSLICQSSYHHGSCLYYCDLFHFHFFTNSARICSRYHC